MEDKLFELTADGPDVQPESPKFPPREWLITYAIITAWGSNQRIGVTPVKSYWGYAGYPKDQLFKDLVYTLHQQGLLEGVQGLGEYREKNGKRVYRANVLLLNREWADLFGPDGYSF
jgi:hypothetical protein